MGFTKLRELVSLRNVIVLADILPTNLLRIGTELSIGP
jgi:hypothetical protein